jgi:hypothetical protein
MIECCSDEVKYKSVFTNGIHETVADTTADKGGGNAGFRPHQAGRF